MPDRKPDPDASATYGMCLGSASRGLAVLSTLLLPVREVQDVSDEYVCADRVFGDAVVPALLALGFARGFIHYLLDRAAFRFSSPRREAGGPRPAAVDEGAAARKRPE